MSDLFNVKIDYEKDQLVFLQGPDSIGNYISLQLKHDVSYDSSASGTLNIVEGEIKGSMLSNAIIWRQIHPISQTMYVFRFL